MFVFSEIHTWQGNDAVRQILVFPSHKAKEQFDTEMQARTIQALSKYSTVDAHSRSLATTDVSDCKAGAAYKLRAVKCSEGTWIPAIRCGYTGYLLWESQLRCNTPEAALSETVNFLAKDLLLPLFKVNEGLAKPAVKEQTVNSSTHSN